MEVKIIITGYLSPFNLLRLTLVIFFTRQSYDTRNSFFVKLLRTLTQKKWINKACRELDKFKGVAKGKIIVLLISQI